jgi:hypothetical protein
MRIRLASASVLVVLAGALALTAATATAAPAARVATPVTVPITAAQSGGTLSGVFTLTNFTTNAARQLVANGTFTGTATDATGAVTQLTNAAVSAVVAPAQAGACKILGLVLGPLHLDLLGLVVDLNEVHLDITAVPGPGKLLGNLLCGIVHILDNQNSAATTLQSFVDRANRVLGRL